MSKNTLDTIVELKEKFPLFEYHMVKADLIQVMLRGGVSMYVTNNLDTTIIERLTIDHDEKVNWKKMMELYPNLYFSSDCHSIWVRIDSRDGYGIPHNYPLTEAELHQWNEIAGQARQKGWFLCFICGQAKPRSEYGYYHFCAEYCKDCLAKNPEVERSARNENYE